MTRLFAALALATCSCVAIAAPPLSAPVPALIVNSIDAPVPVRIAVQADEPVNICATSQTGNPTKLLYDVPADRRLEIEFASVHASRFLEPNESLFVFIATTVQGVKGEFLVGSMLGDNALASSRQMTVSADPGTTITTSQGSVTAGGSFFSSTVCIAGRLTPI